MEKLKSFWRGKRVFITGNTGFKGSWLSLVMLNLGA
jgi:CDP-glucose 4,6-dehydratase